MLLLWIALLLASLAARGPQAGTIGFLFATFGLVMVLSRGGAPLPKLWWILALAFLVSAAACFLPAAWFPAVKWRAGLEEAGIATGGHVVIQVRHALEAYGLYAFTLLAALWLATRRVTPGQLRVFSALFVAGVAVFAILAALARDPAIRDHFGFFPNRNHTGTYLAMGAMCGLGSALQAQRDKAFVRMAAMLAGTGVCLWALVQWSISRGGIVLIVICGICWLPMLGRRYLGANGLRAVALLALLIVGAFFLTESRVKQRIFETAERAGNVATTKLDEAGAQTEVGALDLRIPIALDTFDLVRDFPLTGIGARQFPYVFPQYRTRTAYVNEMRLLHPESDWLWIASEAGIPAALMIGLLVVLAFTSSLRGCLAGHDRALRSACLLAAVMVPLHGIFDVPGHRIELALSAAFLFMLSLRPRHQDQEQAPGGTAPGIPLRALGLAILVAGAAMISSYGRGRPEYLQTRSTEVQREALRLYDQALPEGPNSSRIGAVPLIECSGLLDGATRTIPLDGRLWQLHGRVLMFFPARFADASRAMKVERLLNPTRVSIPLEQAVEWMGTDPENSRELWIEGLRRAEMLDHLHPKGLWRESAGRAILRAAHRDPELKKVAELILRNE